MVPGVVLGQMVLCANASARCWKVSNGSWLYSNVEVCDLAFDPVSDPCPSQIHSFTGNQVSAQDNFFLFASLGPA